MKRFFKLKKLSQRGVLHHLVPIVVIVLLGGITGGFIYRAKAAQPWNGALSVGPHGSGYCMNAPVLQQGQQVKLASCKNVVNQKWQLENAGTVSVKENGATKTVRAYTIHTFKNGVFLCVDDYKRSTQQGKNNRLVLWNCNGTDPAQRFFWDGDGHQLRSAVGLNVSTALCIDNEAGRLAANNPIDLYKCWQPAHSNQDWFETGNSAAASSTPVAQPVNPPTGSTTNPGPVNTSLAVQNWSGALQLGLNKTFCMEAKPGNDQIVYPTAVINKCNHTQAQKWTRVPVDTRRFLLKSATSGACLDDIGGAVGTAGNRKYTKITTCDKTNNEQIWIWANSGASSTNNANNHEIMNAVSTGCVNDPANSTAANTRLIIYSCAANTANEQWFEAAL